MNKKTKQERETGLMKTRTEKKGKEGKRRKNKKQ